LKDPEGTVNKYPGLNPQEKAALSRLDQNDIDISLKVESGGERIIHVRIIGSKPTSKSK
jgi:hypothetical protein